MNVSIVIVNYNTLKLTKACIDSVIEKTSGLEYEIILVDNASSDGSSDVFKNDERIIFIEASDNIGFGKANNLGVKHAKGDYLFFLNSDVICSKINLAGGISYLVKLLIQLQPVTNLIAP